MRKGVTLVGLTLIILAASAPSRAAGQARQAAPWDGLDRSGLILLLGEPSKAKKQSDGQEVLTYRLVRLGPDVIPRPEQKLLDVPGIGPCATMARSDPDIEESVTFEPTATDAEGRPMEKTTLYEVGKSSAADAARRLDEGRKVTLKLTLGTSGRVENWTVSPKR